MPVVELNGEQAAVRVPGQDAVGVRTELRVDGRDELSLEKPEEVLGAAAARDLRSRVV